MAAFKSPKKSSPKLEQVEVIHDEKASMSRTTMNFGVKKCLFDKSVDDIDNQEEGREKTESMKIPPPTTDWKQMIPPPATDSKEISQTTKSSLLKIR